MNPFVKLMASRLAHRQQGATMHPAADLLTAFTEQTLGKGERKDILTHLGTCAECREVIALASAGASEIAEPVESEGKSFGWWHLRWVAALAAACMVLVVVWRSGTVRQSVPRKNEAVRTLTIAKPANAETQPLKATAKNADSAPVKLKGPAPIVRRLQPQLLKQPPLQQPTAGALAAPQLETRSDTPQANSAASLPITPPERQMMAEQGLPESPKPFLFKLQTMQSAAIARGKGVVLEPQQSLWSIAPNTGILWRSDDGGKTRRAIFVDGQTNFLALSVLEADVWAGGEGGMLFHSTDNGAHWTTVSVYSGEERLRGAITGIEARGSEVIKLRTKFAEWISWDHGVSWRRQ